MHGFPSITRYNWPIEREGSSLSLWKYHFELGVGGEGQDTSRYFVSGFGSMFTNYHMPPSKLYVEDT